MDPALHDIRRNFLTCSRILDNVPAISNYMRTLYATTTSDKVLTPGDQSHRGH